MSDARMHYFKKIEYDQVDTMLLSLRPGKFHKLWTLVMQYARATELGANVELPTDDDPLINGYLRAMCGRVRDDSEAYFKKVRPANQANANKRWDEAKDQDAGKGKSKGKEQPKVAVAVPDKPKAKAVAPITMERCLELVGEAAVPERVEKLYHELEDADWIYHGYRLRDLCERCMKCDEMRHVCGFGGVLYFNAITTNAMALEVFNAYCDLGHELKWAFCDTCERFRDDVKLRKDGNVIMFQTDFDRAISNYQEFERVEEFVAVLRKTYKN